jgi:hypothetical protein
MPTNFLSSFGFVEPVNATGLFQVTYAGIDTGFSFFSGNSVLSTAPLAETSIFSGNDQSSKYFAGAKP